MGDTPRPDFSKNKTSTQHDGNVKGDPYGDSIDAGSVHIINALDMIEKDGGPLKAEAYAGGMTAGLREWFIARYGPEESYKFFQRFADDLALKIIEVRA